MAVKLMIDSVILAAGKGERFRESKDKNEPKLPKSLMPLDSTEENTLSAIISHLRSLPINDIYLVLGYYYEEITKWIQKINDNKKNPIIVNARNSFIAGPFFSFREMRLYQNRIKSLLIFPADTWFSPIFWDCLSQILNNFSELANNNFLFYANLPIDYMYGSFCLELDIVDSFSQDSNDIINSNNSKGLNKSNNSNTSNKSKKLNKLNKSYEFKLKFPIVSRILTRKTFICENPNRKNLPLLLPVVILSKKTVDSLFNNSSPSFSTLLGGIQNLLRQGTIFKAIEITFKKLPQNYQKSSNFLFLDVDTYTDYLNLKKSLE
ncbi:MAG: hypothetical protein K9W44_15630 [Candidatus Lokiarchaeota archaeon]|nr:hypothetical protein [Candidatus Harpocratesius repetitus]